MENINWDLIWTVRDVLVLLIFLAGVAAGLYALLRKRLLPGVLFLTGSALMALEPVLDIVLWRIVINQSDALWDTIELIYMVLSTPAVFLGAVLVVSAFVLAIRPGVPQRPPA